MQDVVNALAYMLDTCGHLEKDDPGNFNFSNERAVLAAAQAQMNTYEQRYKLLVGLIITDMNGLALSPKQLALREALQNMPDLLTVEELDKIIDDVIHPPQEGACDNTRTADGRPPANAGK